MKPLLLDLESNNVFPPGIVVQLQNISNCFRLLGYPNSIVTFHKRTQVLWGLYVFVNNFNCNGKQQWFPPGIVVELQNNSNCFRLLGYPNSIVTFHKRTQVLWRLYVFVNNVK